MIAKKDTVLKGYGYTPQGESKPRVFKVEVEQGSDLSNPETIVKISNGSIKRIKKITSENGEEIEVKTPFVDEIFLGEIKIVNPSNPHDSKPYEWSKN
jgi:hypothetical protein